uniref:LRAT domain-containing protein n=1 Tax=Rhabditophanes sp. KR3021 TaxID=114890 RepID=A0AC35TIZ6_9BILA
MNHGLQTEWMCPRDLFGMIRLGDIIEFKRTITVITKIPVYVHVALAVEIQDGNIVIGHLSVASKDSFQRDFDKKDIFGQSNAEDYVICTSDYMDVCGDELVRINNSFDHTHQPFSPEQIVRRFKENEGTYQYSLISNNCEHFAHYIRNGVKESVQVQQAAIIGTSIIATAIGLAAAYIGSRKRKKRESESKK